MVEEDLSAFAKQIDQSKKKKKTLFRYTILEYTIPIHEGIHYTGSTLFRYSCLSLLEQVFTVFVFLLKVSLCTDFLIK